MAIENISRNSGLVKVLANQVKGVNVTPQDAAEADQICRELAQDMNPTNRHLIAQLVGYTVNELQQHELDFLGSFADIKNIGYGDKAQFTTKLHGIKAFWQAKGSTTARSYVSEKKLTLGTEEISARPAMNIIDVRTGNINFSDLISEANRAITLKKLAKVEAALQAGLSADANVYTSTNKAGAKSALDALLAKFMRLGPVSIVGDPEMVAFISTLPSFTSSGFSDAMLDEYRDYGFIGRYNGAQVVQMPNAYDFGSWTPILSQKYLYIIPGGMTGDARNLKVVNEGGVSTFESQNIDDMTYEMRIDEWFGCGWVKGDRTNMGGLYVSDL